MSISYHRGAVERLTKERAGLEKDKGDQRKKIAGLIKDISNLQRSVSGTTSDSMRRSKQRQIEHKQADLARAEKTVGDLERRLATKLGDLNRHLTSLSRAEAGEQRRQEADAKSRRGDEMKHAKEVTKELERQARLQADLGRSPMVIDLARLPTRITVLYLAANPRDQEHLRLDEENRAITEKIRASKYRDAINFASRGAVRASDVQQALNELQPHVVHFSGHGSDEGDILLQDGYGRSKHIPKQAIAMTLSSGSDNLRAVVFNSCFSSGQAEAVTEYVDVAIGMNESIGDEAAILFAGQFYSALGFGLSARRAFQQALNELRLQGVSEDHIPELHVRADTDADDIYLIRPIELRPDEG